MTLERPPPFEYVSIKKLLKSEYNIMSQEHMTQKFTSSARQRNIVTNLKMSNY